MKSGFLLRWFHFNIWQSALQSDRDEFGKKFEKRGRLNYNTVHIGFQQRS